MSKTQRKVPIRVCGNGFVGTYLVRTRAAAVSRFRKECDLPVDRHHPDRIWHGLSVEAKGEVVHYPTFS